MLNITGVMAMGTYSLNYNYAKLKFTLAVDDRSDSMEAVFKVVGDGKVLYSIDISRRFNRLLLKLTFQTLTGLNFTLEKAPTILVQFTLLSQMHS